ncbi:sensor histidine kinase [Ferviditalea candida]|uniref:histidine kinase n=1 Tax=Ferviditalea candida TaxID=3108399 RepID=A0ABU5ZJQ1_9BACL|nr:HAMP domain-containing sensor histidine kinase [Paenibacillaceae bacterium T2]
MMHSLRTRILLSLFVVMIGSVAITVTLFTRFIDQMIVEQTRNQLQLQMDKALDIIQEEVNALDASDLPLRFKNHKLNADFYIEDSTGRVVAASDSTLIGANAPLQLEHENGIKQFVGKQVMYVFQKAGQYTVVLYTPEASVLQIFGKLVQIAVASLVVSSLVIFAIGFLSIWQITQPIRKLKETVSKYEPYRDGVSLPKAGTTEIDELMATFQAMADKIKKHQKDHMEFLQNVSHELRTPLMSIQGYAHAINEQVVSQEKGLSIITQESYRLVRMVDRLMQLTRLEESGFERKEQSFDLLDMVRQTVELLAPAAAEKGVGLQVAGHPLQVRTSGESVFQMLVNLLQNAIRYAYSEVRIEVAAVQQRADGWMIVVDDDGAGVPLDVQERMFQRYYKGSDGQTGLGLAISHKLAETIGAVLRYERSPTGGARFIIEYQS